MMKTLADLDDEELPELPENLAQIRQDLDDGLIARGLDRVATDMAETGAELGQLGPKILRSINEALDIPWDDTRKHYAAECRLKGTAWTLGLGTLVKVEGDRLRAKSDNGVRDKILRIVAEERERIKVIEAQVVHRRPLQVDLRPNEGVPAEGGSGRTSPH